MEVSQALVRSDESPGGISLRVAVGSTVAVVRVSAGDAAVGFAAADVVGLGCSRHDDRGDDERGVVEARAETRRAVGACRAGIGCSTSLYDTIATVVLTAGVETEQAPILQVRTRWV